MRAIRFCHDANSSLHTFSDTTKKMRFARFQGHIEAASQHSISQQKEFLLEELAKWQGANAQYDDITILGFQCTFRDFV